MSARRFLTAAAVAAASILVAGPARTDAGGQSPVLDDPRLVEAVAAATNGMATGSGRPQSEPGTVAVEFLVDTEAGGLETAIEAAGGRVTGRAPGVAVQADVPVASLERLAGAPGVTRVRATRAVNTRPDASRYVNAGPVTVEAVSVTNAAAWHAAGFLGAGAKVGIIDYFNGSKWNTQVASGEVPAASGLFCRDSVADGYDDCPGGSIFDPNEEGHGNAVAEVIHDLAPSAQLYLGRGSSISDSYALIDWFASQGVRIVNRSLGSPYDGPGDGTGELNELVDYAASAGITFINSAGNEGSYQYWRGAWTDADGDNWLEFGPGDETLGIDTRATSGCIDILGLRWSDWGDAAERTNYDVYLYDGATRLYPSQAPDQRTGAAPIELDGVSSCAGYRDPHLRVFRNGAGAGSSGDVLEVLTYQGDLEYWQAASSAGTGIVDSRNRAVLAVGAVDPPGSGRIASYSSQGPTNDGRRKPDLSAAAGLSTSVFGAGQFSGTSASAPVVAGVAALILGAGQAATPQGLAALLEHDVVDRGATGADSVFGSGELRLPAPPVGSVVTSPSVFVGVTPVRLLDTRSAAPNGDPLLAGPLERDRIVDLAVATGSPVPADAAAVALNVTVVGALTESYAQVLPTGFGVVDASSNLNIERIGQTLPNFTIVPVGQGGAVSIYVPSGGHLLVDLLGYFRPSGAASAGRLVPLTPARVLDTRRTGGKPAAGSTTTVSFPASSGLPASGAAAVVVTVTGTEVAADGYVTAFPTGGSPGTSTLNVVRNDTNANTAIVPLGPDRTISLFSQSGAHLIVDLQGYLTDGSVAAGTSGRFVPVNPSRILDTRSGAAFESGAARRLAVAGVGGVPGAGVLAASLNFTAIGARGANGYLQAWPSGGASTSETSNLNWSRVGQTIASGGVIRLGGDGAIELRTFQATDLAVDVNGYFAS